MAQPSVTEQFVRTVGTFAALGPLVGAGVALLALSTVLIPALIPLEIPPGELLVSILGSVLASVAVGYVIGVIPAAVAGILCHMFAQSIRPNWAWAAACMLVGGLCGGLAPAMVGVVEPITLLLLGLCGAAAGAVCGWKLRRSRWAGHAWKP